jgi:anaerobic selenocysteine-containing dehydrogenase
VPVVVSDEVMPGVVSLPHGFGHDAPDSRLHVATAQQRGVSANAITSEAQLDLVSGTAVLNGVPVELSAAR